MSDLHSNDAAVRTVLSFVQRKRFEQIVCLGDFVGYGAEPNQILDRMRKVRASKLYIRGNHDRVIGGEDDGAEFNHVARTAALWTRDQLSRANRHFIRSLRKGPVLDDSGVLYCHGSPVDEDEYLFTEYDALEIFDAAPAASIVFFGHTHLPVVFCLEGPGEISYRFMKQGGTVQLDRTKRYLINPGSVGQPRDRNPESSFVLFDRGGWRVHFYRLAYDIAATQAAILRAGLPRVLADRLAVGS